LASLARLQEELESAQQAVIQAAKIRDEAAKALEEVTAIRDDIAHHQSELVELGNLQRPRVAQRAF
jgi:uncharacterized membrane protein (DUF106 family)